MQVNKHLRIEAIEPKLRPAANTGAEDEGYAGVPVTFSAMFDAGALAARAGMDRLKFALLLDEAMTCLAHLNRLARLPVMLMARPLRIRFAPIRNARCRSHRPGIVIVALLIGNAVSHSAFAQTGVGPAAPAATAARQSSAPPAASPAPASAPAPVAAEPRAPATNAAAAPAGASAGNPNFMPSAAEPPVSTAELPQNLSPWGMFMHADIIVKAVMIGLAFASLVTWTAWIAKSLELRSARAALRAGLRILGHATTLAQAHEELRDGTSTAARLMQAAAAEIRASPGFNADGVKERISWQLERIEMAASRKIARGTGVLATIGSTAPFVGLFGTVWGIMDSFIGISKAHTTNLAVVAPGIAEALLATALGLVAAIPAVMIYNVLARSTAHYRALIGDASAQVMKLVSRDLDRARLAKSAAVAEAAE